MAEKCFCHLNGYAVKDATARAEIETLNETVTEVKNNISTLHTGPAVYDSGVSDSNGVVILNTPLERGHLYAVNGVSGDDLGNYNTCFLLPYFCNQDHVYGTLTYERSDEKSCCLYYRPSLNRLQIYVTIDASEYDFKPSSTWTIYKIL